jgi:hypothetical protein
VAFELEKVIPLARGLYRLNDQVHFANNEVLDSELMRPASLQRPRVRVRRLAPTKLQADPTPTACFRLQRVGSTQWL